MDGGSQVKKFKEQLTKSIKSLERGARTRDIELESCSISKRTPTQLRKLSIVEVLLAPPAEPCKRKSEKEKKGIHCESGTMPHEIGQESWSIVHRTRTTPRKQVQQTLSVRKSLLPPTAKRRAVEEKMKKGMSFEKGATPREIELEKLLDKSAKSHHFSQPIAAKTAPSEGCTSANRKI